VTMIETIQRNPVVNSDSIVVGLGEMKVTNMPTVLSCIGIGSCIAVCVYDTVFKIGGMAHIVLPLHDGRPGIALTKYANTGIPLLIQEMLRQGGIRNRFNIKLAGGAQMSLAPGLKNTFKTGERNLEEVKAALSREGLVIAATDVGGAKGRTVKMFVDTGRVTVRTAGGEEREL
jgi:chemotaxis protein CheD